MNNIYGSWICFVVIMSRFSIIRHLIHSNPLFITAICSVTSFGRSSISTMASLVCFIRILYIYNMGFVEETLGEKWVRFISHCISFFNGFLILILLLAKGEVVSGLLVLYADKDKEIIGNTIIATIKQTLLLKTYVYLAKALCHYY